MPPLVALALGEFEDFWAHLRNQGARGALPVRTIHRVREEWAYWWARLDDYHRDRLLDALRRLTRAGRAELRGRLATMIEADREPFTDGEARPPANGAGAADWVFMQFAHIPPLDEIGIFDEWRLDRVNQGPSENRPVAWTGFDVLLVNPDDPVPIIVVPLTRVPGDEDDYRYNVILDQPVAAACARSAARALLTGNPFMFLGRPRGVAHLPAPLRLSFIGALLVGPIMLIGLYLNVATGSVGSLSIDLLLRATLACAVIVAALWLLAVASDWIVDRRLVKRLDDSQIAWALGNLLPDEHSRNERRIDGQSYAAALAMSLLWSLTSSLDDRSSWLSWHVRAAARHAGAEGITGALSPTGAVKRVGAMREKKEICVRLGLRLLAPKQEDARPTPAQKSRGLNVHMSRSLSDMIWAAAHPDGSHDLWWRVVVWVVAVVLILFGLASFHLMLPPPQLTLDLEQNPIFETPDRTSQALLLRVHTSCPSCFVVMVRSTFWKAEAEKPLTPELNGDVATFSVVLTPRNKPIGDTLSGSIEIIWQRRLPLMVLPPRSVEQMTFATLRDLYEQRMAKGSYAVSQR